MNHDGKNRVGPFLRDRRIDAGLSLREAAARLGISHVFLGEIERSKKPLPRERWQAVVQLFGGAVKESDLAELSGVGPDLQLHLREAGARYQQIGELLLRRAKQQDVPDDDLQNILRLLGGDGE